MKTLSIKKEFKKLERQHRHELKRRRTEAMESLRCDVNEALNRLLIIHGHTAGIAKLVDGIACLRQEVAHLRGEVNDAILKLDRVLNEPRLCDGCSKTIKKGASRVDKAR